MPSKEFFCQGYEISATDNFVFLKQFLVIYGFVLYS